MSTPLSSPGIFNVLDKWLDLGGGGTGPFVGMVPNDPSLASQNTQVLNQIILLAQASCTNNAPYAAVILFPGHYTVPDPDSDGQDTGFGIWQGAQYYLQAPGDVNESPAILINCDNPIRFLGTGNAKLTMNIPDATPSGDMFQIAAGGNNIGGFSFENLSFSYPQIDESDETGLGKIPQWCAIHTTTPGGAQNCRILRCDFEECPISVWFEEALQCSMFQCSIYYDMNAGIAVKLGAGEDNSSDKAGKAKEIYITDCLFNGGKATHGGTTEPPGSTAFWLQGSDHVRVTNAQVDAFQSGVYIAPKYHGNCVRAQFTACAIYVGTDDANEMGNAVLIQPQLSGGGVSQILFEGCYFGMGNMSAPTEDVPGILIDAATNQGPVDTVRFVSCHSVLFPGPGVRLDGFAGSAGTYPANVEVLGGLYSANYYTSSGYTSVDSYGIHIKIASGVRIVGASCVGEYNDIELDQLNGPLPPQDVGIVVDDGAEDVVISGCDIRLNGDKGIVVNTAAGVTIEGSDVTNNINCGILVNGGASNVNIGGCDVRGNGTNGIKVDASSTAVTDIFVRNCNARGTWAYNTALSILNGTGSSITNAATVEVTDCAGYNDQGAALSAVVGGVAGTTTIQNYKWGYWGPLEYYVSAAGGTTITGINIDSHSTHLLSGSFYLAPGETATVTYSPPTGSLNLLVIGK